jgi:integrase
MTKESGVYQRHTKRCPRVTRGRGYAPHRCTGTWSYVIDVGRDANNERRQETKGGFPTKKDAVEQRRKRLGELRTRTGEAYGTTVAAYLEQWLSWKRGLRDTTRVSYRGHLDHYLIPALGQYRLVDLERRPELIEEWVSSLTIGMKGKPLAPASVRRVYSTLRSALNSAVKRRMLSHNPALAVELPETVHYRPVVWDAQQVGVFLDSIQGHRLYALFALTILTGLRRGEALGLRWEDVDYDQGVLYVRQQVIAAGKNITLGPPKTKAGERTVALSEATVALLRQHQARQRRERLQWGEAWQDTGLVFTCEDGRGAAGQPDVRVPQAGDGRGAAPHPAAQPAAHQREPRARGGRPDEGRQRTARALARVHDLGALHGRRAGRREGRRRADRERRPVARDPGRGRRVSADVSAEPLK